MHVKLEDRLFRALRNDLLAGRWREGERLPSERALATEFSLNRVTVRAAVARLVGLGLVTVRRGDGIRAAAGKRSGRLDLVTHMLEASTAETVPIQIVRDMLELLRIVATEAVALACERASAEQLAQLSRIAARQVEAVSDPVAFQEGDIEFVRAVLQASGNMILELLFNTVEGFYRSRPEIRRILLSDPQTTIARYFAIIALISSREAEQARVFMRQSIETMNASALQKLEALRSQKRRRS